MSDNKIKVLVSKKGDVQLPEYKTIGSAGCDLRSAGSGVIREGKVIMVSTGLSIAVPEGYEAQVRTRSGLGMNGIFVINSPGTIDSDFRGEVKVLLANFSNIEFKLNKGDRIAQLIFAPVIQAEFEIVDQLPETERGKGGLGSTGLK